MKFFTGIHHPHQAHKLARAFISVAALHRNKVWRKSDFAANDWIMDSAAFSDINLRGEFKLSPREYARAIKRWSSCGNLLGAFTQDLMCEPFIIEKQTARREDSFREWIASECNGADDPLLAREPEAWEIEEAEERAVTVEEHQDAAIDRWKEISRELAAIECDVPLLPVLQGFTVSEYLDSLHKWEAAGALPRGAYVGVGSICKRQGNPDDILQVLSAIKAARPDLRLHGFGVKLTALKDPRVTGLLYSADSMAWSFSARKQGRDGNDINEALAFTKKVELATS